MVEIIGFHPTNQKTIHLLSLFYSDSDIKIITVWQTSNLHFHGLGHKGSHQKKCKKTSHIVRAISKNPKPSHLISQQFQPLFELEK